MIILCPSCSDPFQLLPASIAPLVQVACPRCTYQLILDFEAVNNPALREAGTQTTHGFKSTADYQHFAATSPERITKVKLEEPSLPGRGSPTSPPLQPPTSILPTAGKISPFQPADKQPLGAEASMEAALEASTHSAPAEAQRKHDEPEQVPLPLVQQEERIGAGAILGVLIGLLIALMVLSYFLRGSWNPLHLLQP